MVPMFHLPAPRKPRERFFQEGADALSLEELVALVLRSGGRQADVLSLAATVAALLVEGLPSPVRLAAVSGLGPAKAASVLAALRLGEAVERSRFQPDLAAPAQVYAACADLLVLPQEHLVVFYVSVRQRGLARETVSVGTATASLIHPREVFRPAILQNASHIILAHNHPSGDPEPSTADRDATVRIARAGRQLGIELADHVICAPAGYVSLREREPELFL